MKQAVLKMALSGLLATLSASLYSAAPLCLSLFIMMTCDYLSGVYHAALEGRLSSVEGLRGIVKKLFYAFAVAVAMGLDYIIIYFTNQAGIKLGSAFFGVLTVAWLNLNEMLSIVENLGAIGVPLPGFLLSAVRNLKDKVENEQPPAMPETKH